LLAAAEAAKDSAWSRTCTIADSAPLTLQFVFDDYVDHMLQHLRHIGVEVDDLALANAAKK
jgi:poly-beta-hydroxyalkanoate depolymerase